MNSLDTNVLFYAGNRDCEEHTSALGLVERAIAEPDQWLVADQVLFELYRLMRNPAVLPQPLSASAAFGQIDFFRSRCGWQHCSYAIDLFGDVGQHLRDDAFPAQRTFDLVLAVTLRHHGVKRFFTHNSKDFEPFGWFHVIDPIACA